jgi:hypothetical protein
LDFRLDSGLSGENVGEPTMKVTVEGVRQPFERDAAIRTDARADRFLIDEF